MSTRGHLVVRHRRRSPVWMVTALALMLSGYAVGGAAAPAASGRPDAAGAAGARGAPPGGPAPALPGDVLGLGGPLTAPPPPVVSAPQQTGAPTEVRIPAIGVRSSLERLDMDRTGALVPPRDYARAGWFARGVVPGDPGPAVIAGHVDSRRGPAVFYQLHRLRPGDVVEVRRGERWLAFAVVATARYTKSEFPAGDVYRPTPGPELRLITCGGTFDEADHSYRDNIVVYAIATRPDIALR